MIWNAAQNHTFTPDFKAYDQNACADLYWNTVIGAVRRHYDYPKIEAVFRSFQEDEDSDVYEGLLWLGLENAVFDVINNIATLPVGLYVTFRSH